MCVARTSRFAAMPTDKAWELRSFQQESSIDSQVICALRAFPPEKSRLLQRNIPATAGARHLPATTSSLASWGVTGMKRRRRDGSVLGSLIEVLFDAMVQLPWQISVIAGVATYVLLRVLLAAISPGLALVIASLFLLPAVLSAQESARKRKMLDTQTGLESIRSLSWRQFEELLGEAFRREGYIVRESAHGRADGGVDLVVRNAGSTYLVQCKQWRVYRVGVSVVREMVGLVVAHAAQGGIVVTSGRFTREAEAFASRNGVRLIDGKQLARMIADVQSRSSTLQGKHVHSGDQARELPGQHLEEPVAGPPPCPLCGRQLVLRQARRGSKAGSQFWGCTGYPRCRHVADY